MAIARMLVQQAPIMVFDDSPVRCGRRDRHQNPRRPPPEPGRRYGDPHFPPGDHPDAGRPDPGPEGGRVADLGSHGELISRPGIYKDIYDIQMSATTGGRWRKEVMPNGRI